MIKNKGNRLLPVIPFVILIIKASLRPNTEIPAIMWIEVCLVEGLSFYQAGNIFKPDKSFQEIDLCAKAHINPEIIRYWRFSSQVVDTVNRENMKVSFVVK